MLLYAQCLNSPEQTETPEIQQRKQGKKHSSFYQTHFTQSELSSRKRGQSWRAISPSSVHMHTSFSLFGMQAPCMLRTPDWSGLCMKYHFQSRESRALRGTAQCQQEQQKLKPRSWLMVFGCHSPVLEKRTELVASTCEEGTAPSAIREKSW